MVKESVCVTQKKKKIWTTSLPTFFIFILLSTICKGVSIRKWSLHSQKENKGSKKNAGTTLSATSII